MEKYHWFKTEWHVKFEKSMQVNGLCDRSRQVYARAMRMLVEYYDKTPDLIAEEELLDTSSTARMSAAGRRPPCASVMPASSSSSTMS